MGIAREYPISGRAIQSLGSVAGHQGDSPHSGIVEFVSRAFTNLSFWRGRLPWLPHYTTRLLTNPSREVQRIRSYAGKAPRDAFISFQSRYVSRLLPVVRELKPRATSATPGRKGGLDKGAHNSASSPPAPLRELLSSYGSDKSTIHDYDVIYETYADMCGVPETVLEVGLGTSSSLPSSMGPQGSPGASARAFRDWGSFVIGCDIDEKTLFSEPGIFTLQIDQLSPRTFRRLDYILESIGHVDLVVIDGLHTPEADLNSLLLLAPWLSPSGLLVVEDVENDPLILDMWRDVLRALPGRYCGRVAATKAASVVLLGMSSHWSPERLDSLYRPRT